LIVSDSRFMAITIGGPGAWRTLAGPQGNGFDLVLEA
jgi:hypothetical protein